MTQALYAHMNKKKDISKKDIAFLLVEIRISIQRDS
jgi:hypothetical protein